MSAVLNIEARADLIAQRYAQQEEDRRGKLADPTPYEREPSKWFRKMFRPFFRHEPAQHHSEAYAHLWEITPDEKPDPAFYVWPRKGGKSMTLEGGAVSLGARRIRKYVLYFSDTQKQAEDHLLSVRALLTHEAFAEFYPFMSTPRMEQFTGSASGWSRNRLWTDWMIFDQFSLESHFRGAKLGHVRPDVIYLDDLDGKHDTIQETRKKLGIIRDDILPLGADNCAVFYGQNLIIADGCMSQLIDGRAGFLLNRRVFGPVKALLNYKHEKIAPKKPGDLPTYRLPKEGGLNIPTWKGLSRAKCEELLNESGPEGFAREYQQDTSIAAEGSIYKTYSEIHHIVTYSEIIKEYARYGIRWHDDHGRFMVPFHLHKQNSMDSGYTVEHPTALKWATRPAEYEPYSDIIMWYRERTRPEYPQQVGVQPEAVSPMRVYKLIVELEAPAREADNMLLRVMSHEQKATRAALNYDYEYFALNDVDPDLESPEAFKELVSLGFSSIKPDKRGGIAQMQDYFELDMTRPHPFRRYPAGYIKDGKDVGGEPVMGRPRQVFAVADGQGELYVDSEGELKVRQAVDDDGMIRSRAERVKYINKRTGGGVEVNEPPSLFNDQMDAERFLAGNKGSFFITAVEGSRNLKREMSLPDRLHMNAIMQRPEQERSILMAERQLEQATWDHDNPENVKYNVGGGARARIRSLRIARR